MPEPGDDDDDGAKWVHRVCALWHPSLRLERHTSYLGESRELVCGVDYIRNEEPLRGVCFNNGVQLLLKCVSCRYFIALAEVRPGGHCNNAFHLAEK